MVLNSVKHNLLLLALCTKKKMIKNNIDTRKLDFFQTIAALMFKMVKVAQNIIKAMYQYTIMVS